MFTGLVIGGALDGMRISHTTNHYRRPKPDGTYTVSRKADGTPSIYQPDGYDEYIFIVRWWVPYKIGAMPNVNAVLERLERVYIGAEKGPNDGETAE